MSDNPYTVLAVSMNTIIHGGQDMLDDIKKQLDEGWITNFVILCSRDKNSVSNIAKYLTKRNHSWAASRIVPRLDEDLVDYIVRVCIDYEVTHFVEPTKRILAYIAKEDYLADIKLWQLKKGGWKDARSWMFRTCPKFVRLINKARDSFDIIQTGFAAQENKKVGV